MLKRDAGYKDLFSYREMIEELLRYFFHPEKIEIETDSLEKVNGHYINGQYRKRENDIVWKMKYKGEWLYLYLLLEFQSTIDKYMGIRLMSYIGLLYEDLIKSKKLCKNGSLPPVLPWVIYTGKAAWSAPVQSHLLLDKKTPQNMHAYFPRFKYHLLDIKQYSLSKYTPARKMNLFSLLIELEQTKLYAKTADFILEKLDKRLEKESPKLQITFAQFTYEMLKLKSNQSSSFEVTTLKEVRYMLADKIKAYEENLLQKDRKKIREKLKHKLLEKGFSKKTITEIVRLIN